MNVNQRTALATLRRATPEHRIADESGARSVSLRCSCGWRWGTNTRNALARSAQIYGAEVQHLKSTQSAKEAGK